MPADRPLEAMAPITAALSLYVNSRDAFDVYISSRMCLAAAEELAVKKAVIKKTSMQTTSKLSADVWRKYENALYQLNAMPGDSKKNVNPSWKGYLTACASLQQANTLKFAGAVASEAK